MGLAKERGSAMEAGMGGLGLGGCLGGLTGPQPGEAGLVPHMERNDGVRGITREEAGRER
jgi:hypothetical protein